MSNFTQLKPKDLMKFFEIDQYEQARRVSLQIKKQLNTQLLTASHLAKYLGVPVHEVLVSLK